MKVDGKVFYRMYRIGKIYWEVEAIFKRINMMIILVKRPKMDNKRRLNQTKSWHTDKENDTPVDGEPMEVLFDTFDEPQIDPKGKIQKRQRGKEGIQRRSTLNQKEKYIDPMQSKSKKVGVLYTLPMNLNGYAPFLINT